MAARTHWLFPLLASLLSACGVAPSDPATDAATSVDALAAAPVDAVPTDAPRDAPRDVDPTVTRGAAVYRAWCAHCHGARGAGSGDGPDLRREVPATTDDDIRRALREGGRMMPVVPIDDDQRADVFAYLRATFGSYQGR